jgi:hypothetical protein
MMRALWHALGGPAPSVFVLVQSTTTGEKSASSKLASMNDSTNNREQQMCVYVYAYDEWTGGQSRRHAFMMEVPQDRPRKRVLRAPGELLTKGRPRCMPFRPRQGGPKSNTKRIPVPNFGSIATCFASRFAFVSVWLWFSGSDHYLGVSLIAYVPHYRPSDFHHPIPRTFRTQSQPIHCPPTQEPG